MVAHFLQSITHRLVLGGELVYHRRPGEEGAILTLAGKYSGTGPEDGGEEERFGAFLGFLACIYDSNWLFPLFSCTPQLSTG